MLFRSNQRRTNAILGFKNKTLLGSGVMHDRLLDVEFTVGPTSFYQTNPEQTEVLYSLAIAQSRLDAGMRVLDAYCGIGTIGLCAAHQVEGLEVVGVERVEGAVADARRNAKANGLEQQARFVCADATSYMIDAARAGRKFDGVILDPPRAGSTSEFLSALCTLAPERVVYVSCNPQTQRRDVDLLVRQGYELDALAVVDLFPQTKHPRRLLFYLGNLHRSLSFRFPSVRRTWGCLRRRSSRRTRTFVITFRKRTA